MATLGWIVIGLIVAGAAIVWVLSILAKTVEAIGTGVNTLGISVFGRKRSMPAKLTEPSELARDPWPDRSIDIVVRKLYEWNPKPIRFPAPSWPKWQPLWIVESAVFNSATIDGIESLFHPLGPCNPPYELIDQPPDFTAVEADVVEEEPPSEPPRVPEIYPIPVLSLPLWQPPLGFLNRYVRTAYAEQISKHRQLELKQVELEESARKLNRARNEAWRKACERHRKAMEQFRQDRESYLNSREVAKDSFQKARDADIEPLRRAKALIAKGDPGGYRPAFRSSPASPLAALFRSAAMGDSIRTGN